MLFRSDHRAIAGVRADVIELVTEGGEIGPCRLEKRCAAAGFDVVSPGCGLSALISNDNLAALVKAVKG